MAKRSKRKKNNTQITEQQKNTIVSPAGLAGDYDIYHVGVLDGIRAVAILIIVWYHIWQQSWLMPIAGPINLDWLVRNGCILVDLMIFLSGFCLFLPYARAMVFGENERRPGEFYVKRVARIAPSYYLSLVFVLFMFAIPLGEYGNNFSFMGKDIFTHLTFTHNLFSDTLGATNLNGVLWTLGLEVQFYLIFPLLAKACKKHPIVTYVAMTGIGLGSSLVISRHFEVWDSGLCVNHPLTFFSVYANGMLGAWLFMCYVKKRPKKTFFEGVLGTVVAILSLVAFYAMCRYRSASTMDTRWQVDNRYLLSLVFLFFVLGTIVSLKAFRIIWDNRVMGFLATISFNLYICHQYLAVKCKEFHFPNWGGLDLPNMTGDVVWQWKYTIICFGFSFLIAVAMTYFVERPMAKWIMRRYNRRTSK